MTKLIGLPICMRGATEQVKVHRCSPASFSLQKCGHGQPSPFHAEIHPGSRSATPRGDEPRQFLRRTPSGEQNDQKGSVAIANLAWTEPGCVGGNKVSSLRSSVEHPRLKGTHTASLSASTFSRVNATMPSSANPSSMDSNKGTRSPK